MLVIGSIGQSRVFDELDRLTDSQMLIPLSDFKEAQPEQVALKFFQSRLDVFSLQYDRQLAYQNLQQSSEDDLVMTLRGDPGVEALEHATASFLEESILPRH